MAKWMLRNIQANYEQLAKIYNTDPLLIRLLVNRGIRTDRELNDYLNPEKNICHNPFLMKDMEKAVSMLSDTILSSKNIRIVGDYDVDGVCSVAILRKGLEYICDSTGSSSVIDSVIPDRIHEGYGLNENMVRSASEDGVNVILTCDNGISAFDEVRFAKSLGMNVIITDHHEIPHEVTLKEKDGEKKYIIPEADAVVDPHQEDCEYPFAGICGAVVAFKLITALFEYMKLAGLEADGLFQELTELAGLATVADIMELKDENRYLVTRALSYMADSRNAALNGLAKVNKINDKKYSTYHLAYIFSPCINAAGRFDSADKSLELLMCRDEAKAVELAKEIYDINEKRKLLQDEAFRAAIELINANGYDRDQVLVVFLPDCHESVAGIIAGKLKELYSRPAVVITRGENEAKGSARSVEAYNIYEEISKVSELVTKYGGHAQAAGFSLPEENIDEFRKQLNNNCTVSEEEMVPKLIIDGNVPFSYFTARVLNEMGKMEPVGKGNEHGVFARKNLTLCSAKIFSEKAGKYVVRDEDGFEAELTVFNKNTKLKEFLIEKYGEHEVNAAYEGTGSGVVKISAAFSAKWNVFKGKRTIQFIMEDFC